MSYQNLRKKTEGFTIIEVLIVLAIAGLIMLIVFLAIPQLRRNQQNSTMRNEASRLLSAVTEYESNANGQQVNTAARLATVVNGQGAFRELTGGVTYGAGTTAQGTARVVIGTCNGDTAQAAAGRTYALQFGLRGGQTACIQS